MGADKGTPVFATSQYTVCTYTQSLLVWVGADKGTPVFATSQYTVCTYTQSLLVWVGADKEGTPVFSTFVPALQLESK